MLHNTALWYQNNGVNEYSEPQFSTPVEIHCSFQDKTQSVTTPEGLITSKKQTKCYCTIPIKVSDKLEYNGQTYEVTGVKDAVRRITGEVVFKEVDCK